MESGTRVYSLNRIFGFHKRERERMRGGRQKMPNVRQFEIIFGVFFSRFRIEKFDKQLLIGTTMRRESLNEKKKKKHRTTDKPLITRKISINPAIIHCRRFSSIFYPHFFSVESIFLIAFISRVPISSQIFRFLCA